MDCAEEYGYKLVKLLYKVYVHYYVHNFSW